MSRRRWAILASAVLLGLGTAAEFLGYPWAGSAARWLVETLVPVAVVSP